MSQGKFVDFALVFLAFGGVLYLVFWKAASPTTTLLRI
jgi:hypothetical protein